MLHRLATSAIAMALAAASSTMGLAHERRPSPDELSRIEAALRTNGFASWEEIEFDDGQWEVDDARTADGKKYDLRLDQNMEIVSRDEES